MEDNKVIRTRNLLLIAFAALGLAAMWANVIGIEGAMSAVVHILLVVCAGALVYFVKLTGLDSLTTTPIPLILIGVLVVAALARFIYAMSYGD